MLRIYASGIVAMMQNAHSIFDFSISDFPRNPVGCFCSPSNRHLPISTTIARRKPLPTLLIRSTTHLRPKPRYCFFIHSNPLRSDVALNSASRIRTASVPILPHPTRPAALADPYSRPGSQYGASSSSSGTLGMDGGACGAGCVASVTVFHGNTAAMRFCSSPSSRFETLSLI
jgi:hypothetical protein